MQLLYKTSLDIWDTIVEWENKIQRTENYILKQINDAPWFIRNIEVHKYLNMPIVKEKLGSIEWAIILI